MPPAQALQRLDEHYANEPMDDVGHYRYGEIAKSVDALKALEHFRAVSRASQHYTISQRHIAHIALLAKRDAEAEQALLALETLSDEDHAVQLSLAELYFRQHNPRAALPRARRAAELDPNRPQTHLLIAELLDDLKRASEMVAPLTRAIELDQELYPAHLNLAYAALYSGDLESAETEARWCLSRNDRDPSAWRFLAQIARERGELDAALEHVRRAVALDADDVEAHLLEGEVLLFQRKFEDAYKKLSPLAARRADDRKFLGTFARAAALSGRRDEAAEIQQQVLKLIPEENPPVDADVSPMP